MTWILGAVRAVGAIHSLCASLCAIGGVGALAGCTSSSGDPGDASPPAEDTSADRITVTFYPCPTIVSLSAAPSTIDRDAQAMVAVDTMIPDGGAFVWTASSGSFAEAGAKNTAFFCAVPGTVTLTATVSYLLCKDSENVMVNCL